MSLAGSRSLFRGALMVSRRSISSFNKTPPAANKGPHTKSEQAMPLGPFYEAIIVNPQPIPPTKPEEPPTSSTTKSSRPAAKKTAAAQEPGETVDTSAAPAPSPTSEPATAQEKAKIIFGTRLAGPVERAEKLKALQNQSTMVAGVLVPPRPEEPDNCCMSGCVNCVWDQYRDDMEEWATATVTAEKRMQEQRAQGPPDVLGSIGAVKGAGGLEGAGAPRPTVSEDMSMDDDGGGSSTNWREGDSQQADISKNLWDDNLYKDIPVGFREFMRTEKKLKERHREQGTVGG